MNEVAEHTLCGVCGVHPSEHASMNHEFSIEGILIPKKEKTPPPRETVRVVPDLVLRQALITKGVLNAQDLNDAEVSLRERLSGDARN